jgi:VanZ family protein
VRGWQQRASPLARYALLAYTLIVVDASLYPFSGWREYGIGAFDFLFASWPTRALPFDLLVNALGYLPLGLLAGLALHPRVRGIGLVALATLYAALLSCGLEAIQTFLPSRVASTSDLASNVVGAFVGALLAARFARPLLDTGRLRAWRARWFVADASRGLVLVVIWLGALIYPDVFMFGMGGMLKAFDPDLADQVSVWLGLAPLVDPLVDAVRFAIAEAVVVATGLVGAGLLFVNLMRPTASRVVRLLLLAAFVVAAVVVKSASQVFVFGEFDATPWLVPGARGGFACGMVLLFILAFLPMRSRWALGLAALLTSLVLTNLVPDNPYMNPVAASLTRGRLMNFYGLARGLNLAWPFFAIAYFMRHRAPAEPSGAKRSV